MKNQTCFSKNLLKGVLTLLFFTNTIFAQNQLNDRTTLHLMSGEEKLEKKNYSGITDSKTLEKNQFKIIQFYQIPNEKDIIELKNKGIELLNYIPDNAYFALFKSGNYSSIDFESIGIRAIVNIRPEHKMHPDVYAENYPSWAINEPNKVDLIVHYFSSFSLNEAKEKINKIASIISYNDDVITARVNFDQIKALPSLDCVAYIELIEPPAEVENRLAKGMHGGNFINNPSGLQFDGEGVTVAVGDGGIADNHLDFHDRISFRSDDAVSSHATHVTGTVGGAGFINPLHQGHAPAATILSYGGTADINAIPTTYNSDGVRITNHSLGWGCYGDYRNSARSLDDQVYNYNTLVHVFSSGNSGNEDCDEYPAGWGNITGAYKVGKNVFTVGRLSNTESVVNSSSRGPLFDGRIKPDICAYGSSVVSTENNNSYSSKSGTSMAAPAVAGMTAQLIHAFRDHNDGLDPKSGLIMSIILNSADDIGNPGPDFRHGFGKINATRAYKNIVEKNYQTNTISNGELRNHTINVPPNTKQLKVMLYWTDYRGTTSASKALINDIDMTVNQNGSQFSPLVLNPSKTSEALLNSNAVPGIDRLNNKEQVVINDPSGTYTVNVNGFAIPQGPQEYFLVYEFIKDEIEIVSPGNGKSVVPNEQARVAWNAFGNQGSFTLQYSTNGGGSWTTVSSNIDGRRRSFPWNVPNISTGEAQVRVIRDGNIGVSNDFAIIAMPSGLGIEYKCDETYQVFWNPVNGAESYTVYQFQNDKFRIAGTTSNNSIELTSSSNQAEYFTVAAMVNGFVGYRAPAFLKTPGTVDCPELSAVFSSSVNQGCLGVEVDFTDLSFGEISSWSWQFDGGSPSISSEQNPTVIYNEKGVYNVTLTVGDGTSESTSTLEGYIEVLNPESPEVNDISLCEPSQNIELRAQSIDANSFYWFEDENAQNPIFEGNRFEVSANETSTYFVSSISSVINQKVGHPSPILGGGDNHQGGFYLVFDATVPFTLNSAILRASGTQTRTLELRDAQGNLLVEKDIEILNGTSRVPIDIEVPAGEDLQIGFAAGADLYRSDEGLNFPYQIDGIVSIKRSTAQSNPVGFYYYLYDWEIQANQRCESDRKAVQVKINDIGMPLANDVIFCEPGMVNFRASTNEAADLNWYADEEKDDLIAVGNEFTTLISSDTTLFVSASSIKNTTKTGHLSPDLGEGGFHQGGFYLNFDVTKEVLIKSALVNADGSGERTLEIRDSLGVLIEEKEIFIEDGMSRIDIDLTVPVGNDFQIGFANGANLFRSNQGLEYPYGITGLLSIKSSTAGTNPEGFYYYLYDWEVEPSKGCEGPVLSVQANLEEVEAPSSENQTFCEYGDEVTFSASALSTGETFWFESEFSDNIIHEGNNFTAVINSDTTFYLVSSNTPFIQNVGENNLSEGLGGFHDGGQYLIFDAIQDFTLVSFLANAQGSKNRTIELLDENNNLIYSEEIFIENGINRIEVNLEVPEGNDLKIGFSNTGADLYRSEAALNYPYEINGLVNIKNSSAEAGDGQDFYYYLYDWEVKGKFGCLSERVSVSASKDICTQVNSVDDNQDFSAYPNPFNDFLEFKIPLPNTKVNIFDAQGRLLDALQFDQGVHYYLTSNLTPGVYIVEFVSLNTTKSIRLIKN